MGRDNQPKHRQARDLARKLGKRPPHDRLLIVCEDSKSSRFYLDEIRCHYRLSTAHVHVVPSQLGTAPEQVVRYARDLFEKGDPQTRLLPRRFERIYAVFDRDDHPSYHQALSLAADWDRTLRSDLKQPVRFFSVASVPCFELWLLLHFEDVRQALHRNEVQRRLQAHFPDYKKGGSGVFAHTKDRLEQACRRARALAEQASAHDGKSPYTDFGSLVDFLGTLTHEPR